MLLCGIGCTEYASVGSAHEASRLATEEGRGWVSASRKKKPSPSLGEALLCSANPRRVAVRSM